MARYIGTTQDDTITGVRDEVNLFEKFGIGNDNLVGGNFNDTFLLAADIHPDSIDGGRGEDTIDYHLADRGLTVNLATNVVSAVIDYDVVTVATLNSIEDVRGSNYHDFITGSSSDNVIEGGGGGDTIDGSGGSDTASYAHSTAAVQIDLRVDGTVQHGGDAEGDKLYSIENVIGSSQADTIIGSWNGNSVIEGGGGADDLSGAAVDLGSFHTDRNTVSYLHSDGPVTINLGQVVQHGGDAENDRLEFIGSTPSFDNVWGSNYGDQLTGNAANNDLRGEGGDDTFYHTLGGDVIEGGAGNDTYVVGQLSGSQNTSTFGVYIDVQEGAHVYFNDGSSDVLYGVENLVGSQNSDILQIDPASGINATTIHGAGGDDVISGSSGSDFLYGDAGRDTITGGAGADYIDGGYEANTPMSNTANYSTSASGVTVFLQIVDSAGNPIAGPGHGLQGDAQGDVLVNIQNLTGSSYDDILVGDSGNNVLTGGDGRDRLIGGPGHDTLIGGPGDDILTGGNDAINWGGSPLRDPDTFVFEVGAGATVNSTTASSSAFQIGNDTITDFTPGVDTLELDGLGASQGVHVVQHGSDAVVTIQDVVGSITLLNTHAADVHWTT
jgi:Ca2+-binding RTX toxin-like protein